MRCLKGIYLLNLVFELKFLDIFMGREDPIAAVPNLFDSRSPF